MCLYMDGTVQSGYTLRGMGEHRQGLPVSQAVYSCQIMPTYPDAMQPPGRTVRGLGHLGTTASVPCGSPLEIDRVGLNLLCTG